MVRNAMSHSFSQIVGEGVPDIGCFAKRMHNSTLAVRQMIMLESTETRLSLSKVRNGPAAFKIMSEIWLVSLCNSCSDCVAQFDGGTKVAVQ